MSKTITATELARSMSDILNRVKYQNERFNIQRNGETIATIAPVEPPKIVMLHDALKALGDLRMPVAADDLEEIQRNQQLPEFPEWPS
jgi:antitoxin (DNA-binding transcriptional repressor) of toxin-antitoxin stability system